LTDFLEPSQIANSVDLFDYLNDIWDLLPESDRFIFGETWKAYEQTYGNAWMKLMERRLSVNVNNCPLYSDYRWITYTFDSTTVLEIAAAYQSTQDFSVPLDLHAAFLVLISVNGAAPIQVNLQGANAFATKSSEIVAKLNTAFNFPFASTTDNGAILNLLSNIQGPTSSITFYPVGSVFQTANINANQSEIVVTDTSQMTVGMNVVGQYIEEGTTIQEVVDATHVILTNDVTLSEGTAAVALRFSPAALLPTDATILVFGLAIADLPLTTPEFPYAYSLEDTTVVGIPILQDMIHPELVTTSLAQDVDFTIGFGSGIIAFKAPPPASMWAPDTLKNQEIPYKNFGYLMGIYAPNTPQYLKAVRGLWYAFWTGPKPTNIETSLYLLFGLPTASQAGTVTLASQTQIVLLYGDGTTETFPVPPGLVPIVDVQEQVARFQPLVSGIRVYDKVNSPGFLAREVGRPGVEPFLTQYATRGPGPNTDETMALTLLEQNTYIPQIDVYAFISNNISLDNIDTFLKNIQPRSRTYLLEIVAAQLLDQLSFYDEADFDITIDVTPTLDMNPNTLAQESDLIDAETNPDSGIVLDCDGFTTFDLIDVAVYQGATLIDSFRITG
jgi:hypothetical protein